MSNNIVTTSDSPFDSIRRFDQNGNEFWSARELMSLLDLNYLTPNIPQWEKDKFQIIFNTEILSSQEVGLALLEIASFLSMQNEFGYIKDGWYFHQQAINLYKGQGATALFNLVFSKLVQSSNSLHLEYNYYPYIEYKWQSLFPWAKQIQGQVKINKNSTVDFVLDSVIPVEIKKDRITNICVNQILRYIKEMNAPNGILIAPEINKNINIPNKVSVILLSPSDIQKDMISSHISAKDKLNARIASNQTSLMKR